MSEQASQHEHEQRLSEWLDSALAAGGTPPDVDAPSLARWQCLHALLAVVHRPENAVAHEQRIQAVLEAIDRDAVTTAKHLHTTSRRTWVSLLATAAAFLLVAGLWMTYGTQHSAYAVVRSAQAVATQSVDRVYRVLLEPKLLPGGTREGKLYVRGNEKLAYRHPTPFGESLWLGTNGREGWFVPPHGPVLVRDDPQYLKQWVNEHGERLPFLQLTTLLDRFERSYELETIAGEADSDERLVHVRGQRRRGETGPSQIDMWADATTGVAQRLVLRFEGDTLVAFKQISFELVGAEDLKSAWYEHAAHHGPDRTVLYAPGGKLYGNAAAKDAPR